MLKLILAFVFVFCVMVGRRFSEYAFVEQCFTTCILWIQSKLFSMIDGEELKSLVKLASFEDDIKEVDTLIRLYMYSKGYNPHSLECLSIFIKIPIMLA